VESFPQLFASADLASNDAQVKLVRLHIVTSVLLVGAAAMSAWGGNSKLAAVVATCLFITSLAIFVFGKFKNYQATWYRLRALAESAKTTTWKFVMGAEPFSCTDVQARDKFRNMLKELLDQNKDSAIHLGPHALDGDQITAEMTSLRGADEQRKKAVYLLDRVSEQQGWYSRKANDNARMSSKWFWRTCIIYGIAIGCCILRVSDPSLFLIPTGMLAVIASSFIGWTKIRRYDELASAYALTAMEISVLKSRADDAGPFNLPGFVADAENAFSREHTQWAARRDH